MNSALIIVPTYNEIENIESLLSAVFEINPDVDILVVDDNSPDGTGKKVKLLQPNQPRLFFLHREKKEGLAPAYLAGFRWAIDHHYDIIIQMDADFSHAPKDTLRLMETLKEADVAVGSRYIDGGRISGWTLPRQIISRGGNFYARFLLNISISEMTGGYNAWKRQVLQAIDFDSVTSKGYAFQVELKYRAFKKGFKIKEIPILFENRKLGKSKMTKDIVLEAAMRVMAIRCKKIP